ncbi:MAG TPA: SUMF1/EgtB/PvdO family nonheme iron enzyme [Candidatus Baltobacteraceae bacterium]|nr:SUMF1/EgtB/PvdO family nonheme iron enzyme [Candidatus Baltobacteraceae bacterium]
MSASTVDLDRAALVDWYRRNRKRSARLFSLVDEALYERRPIALRHPFVFYEGHLPAFSFLTLNERALGEAPLDPALEALFERGIDPSSPEAARAHERSAWPDRERIADFALACDRHVEKALASAALVDESRPRLVRGQAAYAILEHEAMHHETLLYIVHQVPYANKRRIPQEHVDRVPPRNDLRAVSGGIATIGADRDAIPFGWDNEFGRNEEHVPAFSIQQYPVSNADWFAFVRDGGPIPPFWRERDGEYVLRAAFEELALPLSWPVYVTNRQARAYAEWRGMTVPTEAQYHRAAFGSPAAHERPFPWGAAVPLREHGNFDFARFDPEPIDEHPAGASAWGVTDLIGNGWEWTSTPFAPLPGFEPMASYPQYSADFFDGAHHVLKGASPVTARELIRRSYRNWFYDDYPYMYAKFRLVAA